LANFEIFKGKDSQYYWHFKSANGEKICASEGYVAKESCQKAIELVKTFAATATTDDLTKPKP
jgi:uncharacterized protein